MGGGIRSLDGADSRAADLDLAFNILLVPKNTDKSYTNLTVLFQILIGGIKSNRLRYRAYRY